METIHALIGGAFLALVIHTQAQPLDEAEVRITYGELKRLLDRAEPAPKPPPPPPALLSARLRLSIEQERPVLHATFRTIAFGDEFAVVPMIAGDVSLESHRPEAAVLIIKDGTLGLASQSAGTSTLEARLLPERDGLAFSFTIPSCPSVIFEVGELPADQSVVVDLGNREETLAAGQIRPLPTTGQPIGIRLLDGRETREALSPPEPSTWSWQQQALVRPADGALRYHIVARGTAADGSGVTAHLPLPPDAQDLTVTGDDLVSHTTIRGQNRALGVDLGWKTRGRLDRQIIISYRLPLRPLDQTWQLQAPGGEDTPTRFLIATSPFLSYSADGLGDPLTSHGLPQSLAASLAGGTYQPLDAAASANLTVTPIPVAPTEQATVKEAEWSLKIEPDGSMLATGTLTIEHQGPLGFVFDTPPGMRLLSCELSGSPASPVDLGSGRLQIALPQEMESSRLTCAFTRAGDVLDPVGGTLTLALPQTPVFIHSLVWHVDLPPAYLAETHGNLTRVTDPKAPPSRLTLRKNLCRDERPEIHVFYQRADLNR